MTTVNSSLTCLFMNPGGEPLGMSLYIPQDAGPRQLQEIVNKLLQNGELLPYSFFISDEELNVQLKTYLQTNKVSVEKVLKIVYQPQAIFRIRPVNRCSATMAGHTREVLTVAFSPDSKNLASGSGDRSLRLWDLNTQTPLFTCSGHKCWVQCVAWSPDGEYIATSSFSGELLLWNPQTGKQCGKPFTGHKKYIRAISWEPVHLQAPCRRFVSASEDSGARIWDILSRRCIINLTGHAKSVTCVKWGGEGFIYTCSTDCTIKIWETTHGNLMFDLKEHKFRINSLSLSTEYCLRTGAFDHAHKTFFSAQEMKEAAHAKYNKMKGNTPERIVSGSDDKAVFLWVNNKVRTKLNGHQKLVGQVCFSPDGQWIASASNDKSVRLWNGFTGQFVTCFRGHVGPVYQISWSADSRLILSGSGDSTLKIWDIRTRKMKKDLPGHADEVFAVDWSPDGEKVASGGRDGLLKLWMS